MRPPDSFPTMAAMPFLILIFGVFACSTSVIFIRLSETDPVMLSAYRLLLAAALLAPAAWKAARRYPGYRIRWKGRDVLIPGVLLAAHFISWIYGARLTPAGNATLLVNMTPVVMPFMLLLIAREFITRGEGAGTAVALLGVVLLLYSDLHYNQTYFTGDLVCFFSMVIYTMYLAFARRNREIPSIYLYVVPLYFVAGAICLLIGLGRAFTAEEFQLIGSNRGREWVVIAGMAIVPTVIGHSTVNWAFRHIRGQAVSIVNLGQVFFASIMAAIILREYPGWNLYAAAVLIFSGAVIVVRAGRSPGEVGVAMNRSGE